MEQVEQAELPEPREGLSLEDDPELVAKVEKHLLTPFLPHSGQESSFTLTSEGQIFSNFFSQDLQINS